MSHFQPPLGPLKNWPTHPSYLIQRGIIYLSIHLSIYLPIYLSIYLSLYLPIYLSIDLSIYLSIFVSIYLSTYLSIHPSIYLSFYLSIFLSIYLSLYLSVCLSTCLSASLKTKVFCETSSGFELGNIKKEAILRLFRSWQHQKQSNSARRPYFSKLTTSKTKQFCETSSFFEVDNIQNKRILRDFLKKWKVECRADGLVPIRFAIFPVHLSKVLRLPRKSDARSYEVLHLSRKIISANLKIWCSKMIKMQPLSGNQRPDLLTALMKMSLVLRLPRKMHLCRSSSNVPRLPSFLEMLQNPHGLLTFDKVHNPLRLLRGTTSERPKVVRTPGAFKLLTSKCASGHNGVQFLDIATSKSGPKLRCFVHFDLEMCFAPQRRALFRHLNFQKWSESDVFLALSLTHVLRATTACTFSTSQLPKVLQSEVLLAFSLANVLRATTACTFSSLIWPDGSAPAALASLLFDPPEPQTIGKTQCFATFLPFRASA